MEPQEGIRQAEYQLELLPREFCLPGRLLMFLRTNLRLKDHLKGADDDDGLFRRSLKAQLYLSLYLHLP